MNEAEKILHAHGIKCASSARRSVLHDLPTMLGEAQQEAPKEQGARRPRRTWR